MDDLDFLRTSRLGNASLVITGADGTVTVIDDLDLDVIAQSCPLLAFSFESRSFGKPKYSIDAPSRTLVICFLRFLYVGDYRVFNGWYEEPCSLLLHVQLCRMGHLYQVPELRIMAHANTIRDTELSCSRPSPPDDLCEAIRYVYDNPSDHQPIIDTLLHYCVSCFLYHNLASNEMFRKLAYELRSFHQDLCRTNLRRDFADDGALDIVRLPVAEAPETPAAILGRVALGDFLYEMWGDDCTKFFGQEKRDTPTQEPPVKLARIVTYGPKHSLCAEECDKNSDSESDGSDSDGFTLVHRPKRSSVVLECFQNEPNKRGKIDVSLPDEVSGPVRETERLAVSGARTAEGAEEDCTNADTARLKRADPGPTRKPLRPTEQPDDVPGASNTPREPVVTHQKAEETALAFSTAYLVDVLTSESDGDFKRVRAVANLETQDHSDSEWSVV